jgi:hypothetical protein
MVRSGLPSWAHARISLATCSGERIGVEKKMAGDLSASL